MTITSSDADRFYSCAAGSGGSWSRSLCHAAGALSVPAASELTFPDCAGPWLAADDRSGDVNIIPSDGLHASSVHVWSKQLDGSVSSTLPQPFVTRV